MAALHPQALAALDGKIHPELYQEVLRWIERLDSMEPFRQGSQLAPKETGAFTVQLLDAGGKETVAVHNAETRPHTLGFNPDYLPKGHTKQDALTIVMLLRHEQRHHEEDHNVTNPYVELADAFKQNQATITHGLDYMNAKLDSEIVARFADYRVANEAWKLAQQDGDQTLASSIRRELMTNTELNKAFYERERELGRPLTEKEALKDFRLLTLQFEEGTYLKDFVGQVNGLASEMKLPQRLDPDQLREALLRDATPVREQAIDQPVRDLSRNPDGRPAMSALESKTLAEAFEHLGKPYNKGKFDAFSDQEKECLAGVAMQIGMRHVGDPKVTSDYLSSVFLSDNGKMYVSAGKFDVLQGTMEIAEAKQTSLTQSLEVSHGEHQQLLERQQQQELTRGSDGPGGPTMTR